ARHADCGTAFGVDRMGVELPFLKAGPHILDRLVAGLGDMERRHDAIAGPVHRAALRARLRTGELPVVVQRVVAVLAACADAYHAQTVAAGELAPLGCDR